MPPSSPVALITGGTAGLGAAAARLFAQDGHRVAVNFHSNADRAAAFVQELRTLSPLPPPTTTSSPSAPTSPCVHSSTRS